MIRAAKLDLSRAVWARQDTGFFDFRIWKLRIYRRRKVEFSDRLCLTAEALNWRAIATMIACKLPRRRVKTKVSAALITREAVFF
jgi:hypothetical protein